MKEQLITFKTAKLAKEKGFDLNRHINDECSPTQSLLQKWLRDKHNIHLTVTSISQESWQYHITKIGDSLGKNYIEDFYNYEEALELGLMEALKLITFKSNSEHKLFTKGHKARVIGLKPIRLVKSERLQEVSDAICRYSTAGLAVPTEWLEEHHKIINYLKMYVR
jgi:hypothetical protein